MSEGKNTRSVALKLEQRSESPRGLVKIHFPGLHPIRSSDPIGLGENLECLFLSSQMRSRLLVQEPHWKPHTNPAIGSL